MEIRGNPLTLRTLTTLHAVKSTQKEPGGEWCHRYPGQVLFKAYHEHAELNKELN